MHAFQVASLDGQVTGDLRADRYADRVVVLHQLSSGDVFAHSAVQLELDALRLQDTQTAVDDVLS